MENVIKELIELLRLNADASTIKPESEYMQGWRECQKNEAVLLKGILDRYYKEKENGKDV